MRKDKSEWIELPELLAKLDTTILGEERIRRNLEISPKDLIAWCTKEIAENFNGVQKCGKNYYIETENAVFTVNRSTYTLITAHKTKNGGKQH